jgi:phospholipid/cholesterol/gamma-HCH transport system substrate-binding protein
MNESKLRFRLGAVVLFTLLVTAIMIVLFSERQNLLRKTYTIYVHFEDAPGVTKGTPVKKSGILVGRVSDVHFADQDDLFEEKTGVNVALSIDAGRELRGSELCRVTGNVLGDAVLEFVPGIHGSDRPRGDEHEIIIKEGDRMIGYVVKNPIESLASLESDLRTTVRAVGNAGENFGRLSQQISSVLSNNDDQIGRIINKAESALDDLQRAANSANNIFADREIQEGLKRTLKNVPEALDELRGTLSSVKNAAVSAEENLTNLQKFTGPLGENGNAIADSLQSSVGKLEELLDDVGEFTHALNKSEGSLGMLIKDKEAYQRLNRALMNVEDITRTLKPVAYDVRVFSDNLARDPGGYISSGILNKRAPIK